MTEATESQAELTYWDPECDEVPSIFTPKPKHLRCTERRARRLAVSPAKKTRALIRLPVKLSDSVRKKYLGSVHWGRAVWFVKS